MTATRRTSAHSRRPQTQGWRPVGVTLLLLTVTACSATASSREPSTPTPPDSTGSSAVDARRAAAVDVCARFTTTALSVDTATDTGPADARTRAAQQFGTAALVRALTGDGHDPLWDVLVAHRGRVIVKTTTVADDPPTGDSTHMGAAVIAARTAVAEQGWRQELPSTVAYCALTATPAGWKITDVSFTDTTGTEVVVVTTVSR